jgi:hypothetical protein
VTPAPSRRAARARALLLAAAAVAACHRATPPSRSEPAPRRFRPTAPEPALLFDPPLVELKPALGQVASVDARLTGPLARDARLKPEPVGDAALQVTVLPAEGGRASGLRLTFKGDRVGVRTGGVVVSTNVAWPRELTLLYSLRVAGNLSIDPSNPYIDLLAPGRKERVVRIRSTRQDFQLRQANVVEGPFTAAIEQDQTTKAYSVRIGFDEGAVTGQQRGFLGKVQILSNDPGEPKKEIPVFALGTLNR